MEKTTIAVSKDLRDCIRMGAAFQRISVQEYLERLVMADLGLKSVSK